MKQTTCTLLLSIFVSTSVHVSGNYVPIIRRTYCIYAILVFFNLCGWLFGPLQLVQEKYQKEKTCEKRYPHRIIIIIIII